MSVGPGSPDAVPAAGGATPPSTGRVRDLLREDYVTHGRNPLHPGFHALAVHRFGHWARPRASALQSLAWKLFRLVDAVLIRNVYGTEISPAARIGRRVRIGHHQAVTIPDSVIGDDCLVRHGLTLGVTRDGLSDVPVVGRDVHFGPYALVMGGCTIGDGARIGPYSIVQTDVPAGASTFANPARILKREPGRDPRP